MHKTILIAFHEFRQHLRSFGFWISTLALPILLIIVWGSSGLLGTSSKQDSAVQPAAEEQPELPLGYVDQSGLIAEIPASVPPDTFAAFSSEQEAAQALQSGQIRAFYIIPPDYLHSGQVRYVSLRLPLVLQDKSPEEALLLGSTFPDKSEAELVLLRDPLGPGMQHETLTSQGEQGVAYGNMLPLLVSIAVMLPLFTSGSYLFQSLVKEKESRTLEVLLLSLRPRQLLAGKLLGLGTLSLVQYLAWMAVVLGTLAYSGSPLSALLASLRFTPQELLLVIPYVLGGFVLYASLMAGIGALSPDMESSRVWVFVITLPIILPFYFSAGIASDPNSTLATTLSLVPFSAPVAMLLRMTAASVPFWQVVLSLALLGLTSVGIVLLMAHLFKAQTLLSGEKISAKRFINSVLYTK